jgi:DHA2 family multidrug resistance protein-like MFS transporter
MLAICCGTGVAAIDAAIPTVALPTLAGDLGVRASLAVLVVTVYQLVLVMTLLPFSALGYRVGLRRLYQYGQVLFLVATLFCFFSRSLWILLVVRAAQALGASASLSVSSALIRSTFPGRQLGRGLAVNGAVVSSCLALAPPVGGLVLAVASWPWIFAVAIPFAVLSLIIGWRVLPDSEPRIGHYDVAGACLCALTFGLLIAGLESAVHGVSPAAFVPIIASGLVVACAFVRRELSIALPMLPVDLLRRPLFALSALAALLVFTGSMTFTLSLPFRLQQFGFKPGEIGAMITPWPLAVMIVGPLAGILSDRVPAGWLGAIGMAFASASLLLLAFLPAEPTHFDIVWRMSLCGTGYALFQIPNARLIIHAAPIDRSASAGGLVSTLRLTGQTLGATLLAGLFALGLGRDRTPALIAAGLAVVVGMLSLARVRQAR